MDKTARIWDAATGKQLQVLTGHQAGFWTVVFSPDGTKVLTASEDNTARIWDAVTGKQIAVLSGHTDKVIVCGLQFRTANALSHRRSTRPHVSGTPRRSSNLPS